MRALRLHWQVILVQLRIGPMRIRGVGGFLRDRSKRCDIKIAANGNARPG